MEELNKTQSKINHIKSKIIRLTTKKIWGEDNLTFEANELLVLTLVKNGEIYIDEFINHYFSLGAKHIIFLDNASTDDTLEKIKKYKNTTILQTNFPFKDNGDMLMRDFLIEKYGKNKWTLSVDIDEFFDYPFSDRMNLKRLLEYLNENKATAVVTQMLDMFPRIIKSSNSGFVKEKHRYYDLSDISKESYTYENGQKLNTPVKIYYGGIRKKLFNINPCLTKHALLFLDGNTKRGRLGHYLAKGNIADFSAVILHYKFSGNFYNYFKNAVKEEYHYNKSAEYKAYCQVFDKKKFLFVKNKIKLNSIEDLIKKDFLSVSQKYIEFTKKPSGRIEFIIFAHARSGSNSLTYILKLHPCVKIIAEPLNYLVPHKDITTEEKLKIKDIESLKKFLTKIEENYNSFKTLFDKYELDEFLLKNNYYKIIFLKRKNLLRATVSRFLSEQTNIWYCDEKSINDGKEKIKKHSFSPLPVDFVEEEIKYLKNRIATYKNLMVSNKTNFFEVNYEDLFEDNVQMNEKLKKINEIFEFLGYEKLTRDEDINKIKKILDPKNRKINSPQTYESIPNIHEIEEKFGNEETGFLFK